MPKRRVFLLVTVSNVGKTWSSIQGLSAKLDQKCRINLLVNLVCRLVSKMFEPRIFEKMKIEIKKHV